MDRRVLIALIEALNKAEAKLLIFLGILTIVQLVLIIIGFATGHAHWIWEVPND